LGSVRARNLAVHILGQVRAPFGFAILGYAIMPEHVHVLISELPGRSPTRVIQVFKQRVSRALRGKRRVQVGQLTLRFPGGAGELRRLASGGITTSMSIQRRSCERSWTTCT